MRALEGKVALVTGAARGQGRSHCLAFAEAGARVVGLDIAEPIDTMFFDVATEADLAETQRLVEAAGGEMLARTADIRSQDQVDAVVAEAVDAYGGIDVVVANAGIVTNYRKTWEYSEQEWRDVVDVNLHGTFHTVKAVIPGMIEAGRGGSIAIISSLAGLKGYSNIGGYVASKHGVLGLMKTLAAEVGRYEIRVNAVCPGLINTDMTMNQTTFDLFRPDLDQPTREDATAAFRTMQLLPTDWLESSDISGLVLWLSSDAARYVTGVAIPVDGGQISRG